MAESRYSFGDIHGPVQAGSGVQNVAGRDQYISSGDQYVAGRDQAIEHGPAREMLAELAEMRRAISDLRLTAAERERADRELGEVEDAFRQDEPDPQSVSEHLGALTAGLKDAGALASAGSSLIESLSKVARWLGPLGATVFAML